MSLNVRSGLGQLPNHVLVLARSSLSLGAIGANVTTAVNTSVVVGNTPGLSLAKFNSIAQFNQVIQVLNTPGSALAALIADPNFASRVFATVSNLPIGGNGVVHQVVGTNAQLGSNPIADARRVDWSYAGANIVNRTTKSGSTIAAYTGTAATIVNALNAAPAGSYVELGAGTFNISNALNFTRNDVTLRGQGMSTILNFTGQNGSNWFFGGNLCPFVIGKAFSGYGDGTPTTSSVPAGQTRSWSGTGGSSSVYAKGATVLNLATAPTGMQVGAVITLYQANEPEANLPKTGFFVSDKTGASNAVSWQGAYDDHGQSLTQRSVVTAINGANVTISPPLAHGLFTTALAPQVGWSNPADFVSGAGVENLRIVTTGLGLHNAALAFSHAKECWLKGVGLVPRFTSFHAGGAVDYGIIVQDSLRCEIRDGWISQMRGGGVNTTTSYSIATKASTFVKVENMVVDNPESCVIPNIGTMGCYFGSNLEVYVGNDGQESGIQPHESGQVYNCFEFNSFRKFWADLFHGNTMLNTLSRNHMYGYGASLDSYHRFYNFVGNCIEASTVRKSLVTDAAKISRFGGYAYRLGYPTESASSSTDQGVAADNGLGAGTLIWGDYTTIGGALFSAADVPSADAFFPNPVPGAQTVPSSQLYTSRPSFFDVGVLGSVPFPPIGSDVTGGTYMGGRAHKLPARLAYDAAGGNIANFNPAVYGTTGTTRTAASASRADVLAQIALSAPGDTVIVPAGTASWSGNVTISGITLKGPGKNAASPTIITAGRVIVNKHASANTKLEGFRFTGTDAHLTVGGTSSNRPFLILDNYFNISETNHGISIEANGGVIASNDFIGPMSLLQSGGNSIASTLGATSAANAAWAAAPTFGTLDTDGTGNVYVEDNTITNLRDGWDCDDGSKMVFRHNTLNDSSIITHGGGSGSSSNDTSTYGCRQLEIYENTFNRISTGVSQGPINRWVWFRGSSGVIANNVMDEANSSPNWTSGQQVLLSVGCAAGPYPRRYQTGQSAQVEDATPNHPILIAGNTGFGVPSNEIDLQANPNNACSNPSGFIQLGRDYVTTNTWGWVPYTYPHPLRS